MGKVGKAVGKFCKALGKIGKALGKFCKAMGKVNGAVGKVEKPLGKIDEAVGGFYGIYRRKGRKPLEGFATLLLF